MNTYEELGGFKKKCSAELLKADSTPASLEKNYLSISSLSPWSYFHSDFKMLQSFSERKVIKPREYVLVR